MRRPLPLLTVLSLLIAPAVQAESSSPPPDDQTEGKERAPAGPFETRRVSVSAVIGSATPTGVVGLESEVGVTPWMALAAGGGIGGAGLRAAGVVRIRRARETGALGISLGGSYGGLRVDNSTYLADRVVEEFERGVWVSSDVYFEHRQDNGWLVRGFLGVAGLVEADGCTKTVQPSPSLVNGKQDAYDAPCVRGGYRTPYLGMALGRTF